MLIRETFLPFALPDMDDTEIAEVAAVIRSGWRHVFLLPVVYAILHLSYGFVFVVGLLKFWNQWGDRIGRVPRFDAQRAR